MAKREDSPPGHRLAAALVQPAIFFGLYLCFAGRVDRHEVLVGAFVALVATAASTAVWQTLLVQVVGDLPALATVRFVPWQTVSETALALRVLARHLFTRRKAGSILREVDFDEPDDPRRAALRRALAITLATMTPGTVVLGFDRERRKMLFHLLEPGPVPRLERRLGAHE